MCYVAWIFTSFVCQCIVHILCINNVQPYASVNFYQYNPDVVHYLLDLRRVSHLQPHAKKRMCPLVIGSTQIVAHD